MATITFAPATWVRPPDTLLRDPLAFLTAEHGRHRLLCDTLLAADSAAAIEPADARSLVELLTYDLALHVIDEEEDLFPLLRRRGLPEDEIETVLGELSGEHADEQKIAHEIVAGLRHALAKGWATTAVAGLHEHLRGLARVERWHLAREDAVVLPIARRRLGPDDQADLGQRMAARRGIDLDHGTAP
jgi:iron-sulfur cluster repair protein YtfE (RIC family)